MFSSKHGGLFFNKNVGVISYRRKIFFGKSAECSLQSRQTFLDHKLDVADINKIDMQAGFSMETLWATVASLLKRIVLLYPRTLANYGNLILESYDLFIETYCDSFK